MNDDGGFFGKYLWAGPNATDKDGNIITKGSFANSNAMAAGKLGLGTLVDVGTIVNNVATYRQQERLNKAKITAMHQDYGLKDAQAQNNVADKNARQYAAYQAGMAGALNPSVLNAKGGLDPYKYQSTTYKG